MIIDWLCWITHNSLTVYLRCSSINWSILMPTLHDIERNFHHIIHEPVRQATIEAHIIRVCLYNHTLLITISKVSIICCTLVATTNHDIMIMCKCSACHSIKPVCVISLIIKLSKAIANISSIHHIQLFAERR